jgi:hypothetical protein
MLAVALLLTAPGTATAGACEVGQPSAHDPPSCDPITTEVLVIGCGEALGARVEIAAYRTVAFGYFVSFVRGCEFAKVKATTLNRRGRVVGTENGGTPGCL